MDYIFDLCVELLEWGARMTGLTYKEINIWVFVIIHPLLTLIFFLWALYLKAQNRILLSFKDRLGIS